MKILITNDDGIRAKGLYVLRQALREIGEVLIVAPETGKSAISHAITLYSPLRIEEVRYHGRLFGYATNGTPADCVKIAVNEILGELPDVVISGINPGSNVGINILYSGTVSAATEAAIFGIPAAAVSVASHLNPIFEPAAKFAKKLVPLLVKKTLPKGVALNVNVPSVQEKDIKGIVITKQASSRFQEEFERFVDPRGGIYYWQGGQTVMLSDDGYADIKALREGYISITPIHHDMTHYQSIEILRGWELSVDPAEDRDA